MKTWDSPRGPLHLSRPPFDGEDPALQAWNGADRILAARFTRWREGPGASETGPVLILNDAWGALACLVRAAGLPVWWVSDSLTAHRAVMHNLEANHLAAGPKAFRPTGDLALAALQAPADPFPGDLLVPAPGIPDLQKTAGERGSVPSLVLMAAPRNHDHLDWQLSLLAPLCRERTIPLWLGLPQDQCTPPLKQIFSRHFPGASASPAESRARVLAWPPESHARAMDPVRDSLPGTSAHPVASGWPRQVLIPLDPPLGLMQWPGVFSRNALDPASLLLLQVLANRRNHIAIPENPSIPVLLADMGCGSGVLALAMSRMFPHCRIEGSDESAHAVLSARQSLANLAPDHGKVRFLWGNALDHLADDSCSLVLCNPPFHFQGAQTLAPARMMFASAARVLMAGASLLVVANRHLGHHRTLQEWFPKTEILADDGRFLVVRGQKAEKG